MSKPLSQIHFSYLELDRTAETPLHRQLYEFLRQRILLGSIQPGTRLPSTRALAVELNVSRNTVLSAYRQLRAEGYLESNQGADTRVTGTLPEKIMTVEEARRSLLDSRDSSHSRAAKPLDNGKLKEQDNHTWYDDKATPPSLSQQGKIIVDLPYPYWDKSGSQPFSSSVPAVDQFPFRLWEKAAQAGWRQLSPNDLAYPSPLGYWPLRETLASHLRQTRGVNCTADQVIITSGAQQALSSTAMLLLNKGDAVWVENPSYNGVKIALRLAQANIVPVGIDEQGLIFEEGVRKAPRARMVCISPSHQYPLGVTMSLTRRLELLQWAEENDAWIIEDDYDSEYRYSGYPLEALQGLDNAGRVIYIGTFSKVLYPGLRLGYMVVPPALVEPFRLARAYLDRGSRLADQVAVNLFLTEGHLARHIRRMRTLYANRQQIMVEMAEKFLRGRIELEPSDAGLHLVGWLPYGQNDQQISQTLMQGGIYAPPLSYFSLLPLNRGALIMGYAAVPEDQIVAGIKRMAEILGG